MFVQHTESRSQAVDKFVACIGRCRAAERLQRLLAVRSVPLPAASPSRASSSAKDMKLGMVLRRGRC